MSNTEDKMIIGRFAPSPSGRMHMGNVYAALMSYLSARSQGGRWVLRIEDLDPQRSKEEYISHIKSDLEWLGLEWDNEECRQSRRGDIYRHYFDILDDKGLLYPCRCRRADILATQAPHGSDGRVVYAGTCRPSAFPFASVKGVEGAAIRLVVGDKEMHFTDGVYGMQNTNLKDYCGDFVVRRADGAWAYQLAVVVDDALMGVTEVVRGCDLLLSTAQQLYLYDLLGLPAPSFTHLPLLCNAAGQRLSKRDASLAMDVLRSQYTPEELLGTIAYGAGILPAPRAASLEELIEAFDIKRIPASEKIILSD